MLIDMILHAPVTVNIVVVNNADSYVKSSAHRNCCHSDCSESLPQKMSLLPSWHFWTFEWCFFFFFDFFYMNLGVQHLRDLILDLLLGWIQRRIKAVCGWVWCQTNCIHEYLVYICSLHLCIGLQLLFLLMALSKCKTVLFLFGVLVNYWSLLLLCCRVLSYGSSWSI